MGQPLQEYLSSGNSEKMTAVLTIIVTYNAMQWVDRCIGSVLSSTMPSDIFVVDNLSTDGTADYIADNYKSVHLVRSNVNLRFGRGNNLGFEYALAKGYEYVYLLNQDAWVKPETFEILTDIHVQHPEYGLLSPLQLNPSEQSYEFMFNWLVASHIPNKDIAISCDDRNLCYPIELVQAAHWLISRRCLEIVGGFSPSFPHYGEDNNYCHRVLFHKLKIGVVPAAKAVHDAVFKNRETNKQKRYIHYIYFVDQLSDIMSSDTLISRLVFLFRRARGISVQENSMNAYVSYLKVLFHLPMILRNNRISRKQVCAFLNVNK